MFFFFVCVIKWQSSMRAFIQSISFFFFFEFYLLLRTYFPVFPQQRTPEDVACSFFFFNVYFVQMNA